MILLPTIPQRVQRLVSETKATKARDIAEFLEFEIKMIDLPTHINGFWAKVKGNKYICVDNKLEDWQQRAVIAHELGHYVLHPEYIHYCMDGRTWYCNAAREDEADSFAVELFRQLSDIDPRIIDQFLKTGWK